MRLVLDNFSCIKHADVTIDGITVIAGLNNTGKSTIGKALFSTFSALNDVDTKIAKQRVLEVQRILFSQSGDSEVWALRRSLFDIMELLRKNLSNSRGNYTLTDLQNDIHSCLSIPDSDKKQTIGDILYDALREVIEWPREKVFEEALLTTFRNTFDGQVNTVNGGGNVASVQLIIKGKKTTINIEQNSKCNYNYGFDIVNKAVFIATPYATDELNTYLYYDPNDGDSSFATPGEHLRILLSQYIKRMADVSGALGRSITKEKLSELFSILHKIVPGTIKREGGRFSLLAQDGKQDISFRNLSTGIKAFIIIRMLLEAGLINKKDVLILDEPEIHLHPKWQLTYANLIVLLQKLFDLSIVITSHSPFFIDAINQYTKLHDTATQTHYYYAKRENDTAELQEVTNSLSTIYATMAEATTELSDLASSSHD